MPFTEEKPDRTQILAAHPLLPFLKESGIALHQSGDKFTTSFCPRTRHAPAHRCVTIYPTNNSWACHDCGVGGTIIDWLVHARGLTIAQAFAELSPIAPPPPKQKPSPSATQVLAHYDYTDQSGKLLYQQLRYFPKDFRTRQPNGTGWKWDLSGVTKVLYHLPQVAAATDVILVEGEKDADSLTSLGYTATTNLGGAKSWLPGYWASLSNKNLTLIPDNDEDGNNWLTSVLRGPRTAASLKILRLPQAFKDTSDFLNSFSSRAEAQTGFAEILQKTRYVGLPPLVKLASLLNGAKPPLPHEIVAGLLHKASKCVIGGTSKGRKTFCLLDLALSVATGSPWWGFDCTQGKVCYINFELQDAFFVARAEAILKAKNLSCPEDFFCWNLRGRADAIEKLIEDIITQLLLHSFVLVVIDPIYKALGRRDENKAGDIASLLNELERVAVETGAAVIFGAHFAKGNASQKDSIDRIGGSGVFARDPDSILTMTTHEEPDAFTVDPVLRNFPPVDPFVVRWSHPLFYRDDLLDPDQIKQPKKNQTSFKEQYSTDLLLEQLEILSGKKPIDICSALRDSHDISRKTVYRMKDKLLKTNRLRVKDGLWFKAPRTEAAPF